MKSLRPWPQLASAISSRALGAIAQATASTIAKPPQALKSFLAISSRRGNFIKTNGCSRLSSCRITMAGPRRAAARARASRRWRRQTSRIPEKFVFSCQTASGVSQPLDSLGFGKKQLNAPGKTGKFHPAELVTTCHRFAVEQWID